nr:type II toxin-antitoxin system RelE/ParE family toxin [Pantoea varia]
MNGEGVPLRFCSPLSSQNLPKSPQQESVRSPPGNRYEELNPPLEGYASIRVNEQYRLIFKWIEGKAVDLYLDAHSYKTHK